MDQKTPPPHNSQPENNSSFESRLASFRMPMWGKIGLLSLVIALASIGYLNSFKHAAPTTSSNGTDLEELARESAKDAAKRTALQDFILTDAEGQQKKLSEYRGNVVILSFWASWCAPCLEELPTFSQLEKRFLDKGLRVLAVNVEEGTEPKDFAKKFWSTQHFSFPSFFDNTKALAQQFEVEMLPANFVIDKAGRLAFSSFGANDWTSPDTVEIIEGLMQENVEQVQ